jgi:hypothetical protein
MGKKKRAAGPTFWKVSVIESANVSFRPNFCQASRPAERARATTKFTGKNIGEKTGKLIAFGAAFTRFAAHILRLHQGARGPNLHAPIVSHPRTFPHFVPAADCVRASPRLKYPLPASVTLD